MFHVPLICRQAVALQDREVNRVFWEVVAMTAFGGKNAEIVMHANGLYKQVPITKSLTLSQGKRIFIPRGGSHKNMYVHITAKRPVLGYLELDGGDAGHFWRWDQTCKLSNPAVSSRPQSHQQVTRTLRVRAHHKYRLLVLDQSKTQVKIRIGENKDAALQSAPVSKTQMDAIKYAIWVGDQSWGRQKRAANNASNAGKPSAVIIMLYYIILIYIFDH